MCIFEALYAESSGADNTDEPEIETVVIRRKKHIGKRDEDLAELPTRIERHELSDEQLTEIYGENGWKQLPDEVLPLVEAYFAWVKAQNPLAILSEKTRDGLSYSINHERQLKTFLENGMVPIDNSATERAIRPFTIGRADWHIIDTVHGAEASAVIYSLVETAKANNLKIYEYLKYLLEKIPEHMEDTNLEFTDDLLTWSESLPDCCRR